MASATITANTAATIHGRLLAQTAAVNLDTNTITTSNCASSATGTGGGTEATTPAEATTLAEATKLAEAITAREVRGPGAKAVTTPLPPIGSKTTGKPGHRKPSRHHPRRRGSTRHVSARPALPHTHGSFTG
jgi:hypothetical protein